jgi:hypothetical protein
MPAMWETSLDREVCAHQYLSGSPDPFLLYAKMQERVTYAYERQSSKIDHRKTI